MKVELMAADEDEAAGWLRKHTPKAVDVREPGQLLFDRRGVYSMAGVFRTKRVIGL
jgi:hypothetical protein